MLPGTWECIFQFNFLIYTKSLIYILLKLWQNTEPNSPSFRYLCNIRHRTLVYLKDDKFSTSVYASETHKYWIGFIKYSEIPNEIVVFMKNRPICEHFRGWRCCLEDSKPISVCRRWAEAELLDVGNQLR